MTARLTLMAAVALALMASGCAIVRSSGPDENRAEAFEFTPSPVNQQETVEAFKDMIGSGGPAESVLDETTVVPLGKINTSAGPIVFAEFQIVDAETGRSQCTGRAGPGGGGWGCGPIGQQVPDDLPLPAITLSGSGSSGTWSDVELRVSDQVAHLEAVAGDGTTYRMVPISGYAWMEWKTIHGELVITAFDADGELLGSVETAGD